MELLTPFRKSVSMKFKLILGGIFCFLALNSYSQDKINWMSMDEALEAQKENPKKIMLDAYTNWCPPCKLMDDHTYSNQDVIDYVNENFYPVKFNAEGQDTIHYKEQKFINTKYDPARGSKRNYSHPFAHSLQIRAYPTTVFFNEDAGVIAPIPGYLKPQQFEVYLKMVSSEDYKKIKSQDDFKEYYQNFEPSFED